MLLLSSTGRMVIAVGSVVGAATGLARAADLPPAFPGPAPAVAPTTGWAGFYIGGQLGVASDSVGFRNLGTSGFFSPVDARTQDRGSDVIGGGQFGYNFQFNRIVFGIEGSMSGTGLDRSFASRFSPGTDVWSSDLNWLGTVTGRVGYDVDNWLPYVKGGYAVGSIDTSLTNNALGVVSQGSSIHNGWTAGGGIEYKINPRFSLGLEVMYTDLGRSNDINGPQTTVATGATVPGTAESYGVGLRSTSIMGRLNYLFGR